MDYLTLHPPRLYALPFFRSLLVYERIATYAFFGHHPGRTYSYRVCNSDYLNDGTKYNDWVALIESAMRQWELATPIITSREPDDQCSRVLVGTAPVEELLKRHQDQNDMTSEIRVTEYNLFGFVLQVSTDIYQGCLLGADACVTSYPGYSDPRRHAGKSIPSADISFKESYLEESYDPPATGTRDDFNRPTSVSFNKCMPDLAGRTMYDVYRKMLHEIGHTLGLSNAGEPGKYLPWYARPFSDRYSSDEQRVISHPEIPDSVMNYDGEVPENLNSQGAFARDEFDCSPHPFDVMAAYALYQNVP